MAVSRQCWICFGEEQVPSSSNEKFQQDWVSPCRCKGSTQWVHQKCLLSWLNSQRSSQGFIDQTPPVRINDRIINDETLPLPDQQQQQQGINAESGISLDMALELIQQPMASISTDESAKCPQCHFVYRIQEETILPPTILSINQKISSWSDSSLIIVMLGGISASLLSLSAVYGLGAMAAVTLQNPFDLISQQFASNQSKLSRFASATRIGTALFLSPIYALSMRYSSLSIFYPLIPALAYHGPHSYPLDMRSTSWQLSLFPFAVVAYRRIRQWHYERLFASKQTASLSLQTDALPLSNDASNQSSSTAAASPDSFVTVSDTVAPSETTTELIEAEILEDRMFRISLLDSIGALLLPFASSFTGSILFSLLPRLFGVPDSIIPSPLIRSMLGALTISLMRDASRTVTILQRRLTRRTRRILDFVE